MEQTRQEHLQWCKDRAIQHVENGDCRQALASMFSDLGKHPETANHLAIELGMRLLLSGNLARDHEVTEFINGFN